MDFFYKYILPGFNTFTYFSILTFSFSAEIKSQEYLNSFYFEGLGNGIYFSVNYERFIEKEFNFRIGISSLPSEEDDSVNSLIIPITFSYFIGEGDLKFEVGGGMDIAAAKKDEVRIIPTGIAGIRYQFDEKGIFLKAAYTPFVFKGKYTNWLGIGIGYKF